MSHVLKYNVADQIAYFRAYDTDGTAKTDLDSSTTGLTLSVFRVGASSVSIASLSDKAADDSTHADGAIRNVGGNLYTIDIPDAATATQVPSVVVRGSYTGGVVEGLEHPIVAYDPAVNYASATTAAAIETDTQDIQNRLPAALSSGRMVSYVEDVGTSAQDQIANAVANLNPSGKGADTLGGQIARTYTNSEEAEIIIGAIVQDTVDIQSRLPAALVGGRMDASVGAMANNVITAAAMATDASAEIADAVCDEVLTGATHNVPGSLGRRIRTLADTVILKDGETVAADNAGSINGSNGLGRIKLQPDVGTVCRGQAVRVAGQVRYIEAYDADTQYATVDTGWCSIPEAGDEYTIFSQRTPLIQRINSADEDTIAYPIAKLWEMLEDSSGYRFTEKALEEAPSGGGGTTIIPAASFAPARTDTTNLIAYVGETISQVLVVYEADGTTPLDLSGKTLTVVFEDMETTDTGVIASASVTVSGDNNNIVTFAYPSAVTASIGQYRYALRDEAAPKTVYSQGLLLVKAAANKD